MSELVHGEDRHPVRGMVGKLQSVVYLAYRVREGPAPWHNQQPTGSRDRPDRLECGIELLGVRQETTADLDDRLDRCFVPVVLLIRHVQTPWMG